MTQEEFDELNEIQGGLCAICREEPVGQSRLHVDHDHDSGIVRGLLCRGCNHGLGNFRDSPDLLERAIAYLSSEPISLRDGTTFEMIAPEDRRTHGSREFEPHEDQVLIANQLRAARGGRTKTSIAKAIGTTVGKITHLESLQSYKGDLDVLSRLLEYYGMVSAITESGRFIIFYPELFDIEETIDG